MCPRRDLVVTECGDAVDRLKGAFMCGFGVLERLSRMLRARQVILFSAVLLGTAVGVRGEVVEFGRTLMILIMRSVVITCGHGLKAHNLPGLGVGFPGEFISTLRVLERAFVMPVPGFVFSFLVMFGCGAMGVRRAFVFLGCSSV